MEAPPIKSCIDEFGHLPTPKATPNDPKQEKTNDKKAALGSSDSYKGTTDKDSLFEKDSLLDEDCIADETHYNEAETSPVSTMGSNSGSLRLSKEYLKYMGSSYGNFSDKDWANWNHINQNGFDQDCVRSVLNNVYGTTFNTTFGSTYSNNLSNNTPFLQAEKELNANNDHPVGVEDTTASVSVPSPSISPSLPIPRGFEASEIDRFPDFDKSLSDSGNLRTHETEEPDSRIWDTLSFDAVYTNVMNEQLVDPQLRFDSDMKVDFYNKHGCSLTGGENLTLDMRYGWYLRSVQDNKGPAYYHSKLAASNPAATDVSYCG